MFNLKLLDVYQKFTNIQIHINYTVYLTVSIYAGQRVKYSLFTNLSTLYCLYCTIYNVLCNIYSAQYTLHYTLHGIQSKVYCIRKAA